LNCAAVNLHDAGAFAGDQAAATIAAWSATTDGSVANLGRAPLSLTPQ
jgi:hypothetical protein